MPPSFDVLQLLLQIHSFSLSAHKSRLIICLTMRMISFALLPPLHMHLSSILLLYRFYLPFINL
jgi:hypothetical protein